MVANALVSSRLDYYVHPSGGVDILFLLFPASGRLVSAHLKEKYLSYLYQFWHGCLLG